LYGEAGGGAARHRCRGLCPRHDGELLPPVWQGEGIGIRAGGRAGAGRLMRVTVLGCGGSGGVPLVGGDWGCCNPDNPKNRRRRVSALVEQGGTVILIATSPDLRAQLLDAGVTRVDAVLYTHDHADHCHGIDDLRFLRRAHDAPPIPAYGTAATLATLSRRFDYIFRQSEEGSGV